MPKKKNNNWKKQLHTWHWVSSAVSLICMILFAITGITLNHAKYFEATADEVTIEKTLPDDLLQQFRNVKTKNLLPSTVVDWLQTETEVEPEILNIKPEWSEYEIYIQRPLPGGDQWLSIDLESGDMTYMHSDRGWIAWLNDLHKGRNTNLAWIWFIDIFSIATLIFCITGLILLQIHSKRRPSTWYITFAGVLVPGLIAMAI